MENVASENKPAKNHKRRLILIAGAIILVLVAVVYWWRSSYYQSTDDAFIEADIAPVNSQIAGPIKEIAFVDNQVVKAGQLLVKIDPRDTEAELDSAQAGLAVAKAVVESSKAQSAGAEADVVSARADADRRDADRVRYKKLDTRAVSRQQFDTVEAAAQSADAALRSAETKASAAKAQIGEAIARVQQAQAALEQAQLNFSYNTIASPIDGRVTRKGIELGQYVDVGTLLLSIVPTDVYVTANFKETQLTKMVPGQKVTMTLDSYPDIDFTGVVDSIQAGSGARFSLFPPENATGNYVKVVQRVPVKIVFDPPHQHDVLLVPGMSVVPRVDVTSK